MLELFVPLPMGEFSYDIFRFVHQFSTFIPILIDRAGSRQLEHEKFDVVIVDVSQLFISSCSC